MALALDVPLDRIAVVCRRYRVREIAVFGSAAKGSLRPESDIDLLVDFEEDSKASYFDLFAFEEELAEVFGRPVEATTRKGLKPWIRPGVEKEAEVLYRAA